MDDETNTRAMIEPREFFNQLERVSAAADKLPRAEPGVIKDQGGFRFVGCRIGGAHPFTQWEVLGPSGFSTGVRFGHWEI